jgi:hypothetical protein
MARYEGSKEDEREDRRGAKKAGMSRSQYERTAKDKREDHAGQKRVSKKKK